MPKDTTGYICQIREISGRLVYTVLNFYEWKLIDVIINKKNKEDFDENSVLSALESELGNLEKKEIDGLVFYHTKKIKLNKTQTTDINTLIDWFFDSYVVGESFRDENMISAFYSRWESTVCWLMADAGATARSPADFGIERPDL